MSLLFSYRPFYFREKVEGSAGFHFKASNEDGGGVFPSHLYLAFLKVRDAFHVSAVLPVNDYSSSPGNVTNNWVPRYGFTALGKPDHKVFFILHPYLKHPLYLALHRRLYRFRGPMDGGGQWGDGSLGARE